MRKIVLFSVILFISFTLHAQLKWVNVDSLYQPLPSSVHIYFTDSPIDTGKFRAYYLIADLKGKNLEFTVDTSKDRRLTPAKFYEKNDNPLVVVNTTFFSFATNQNLNVVVKNRKIVSYNIHTVPGKGKDTLTYKHPFGSAIGISKDREADVAWTFTDSAYNKVLASQSIHKLLIDPSPVIQYNTVKNLKYTTRLHQPPKRFYKKMFFPWKMNTAVGGGPVLLQYGNIHITNNDELKFTGKAINDKHPRTAMGYTKDGKLVILVIEGRNKNASGATLTQEAQIFKDLGCWEALNLDGGGSSCMLVNGKETIKVSDAVGQRPVPAVFIIRSK